MIWCFMRVISRKALRDFWRRHRDSEQQLRAWFAEAGKTDWKTPSDIKKRYGHASIIGDNRVVFNICGNKYRLIVKINYDYSIVYIRFVGTHREYDNINAEKI
ncbi:MAG: type II toxin-antitoxin system HigB family toxin [Kiloniellales bacterium]